MAKDEGRQQVRAEGERINEVKNVGRLKGEELEEQ
jgi:hypothetical protein